MVLKQYIKRGLFVAAVLCTAGPAHACFFPSAAAYDDLRYSDRVVIGKLNWYEIRSIKEWIHNRKIERKYAVLNIEISEVLSGKLVFEEQEYFLAENGNTDLERDLKSIKEKYIIATTTSKYTHSKLSSTYIEDIGGADSRWVFQRSCSNPWLVEHSPDAEAEVKRQLKLE